MLVTHKNDLIYSNTIPFDLLKYVVATDIVTLGASIISGNPKQIC